jgi:hypothetical protein
MFDFSVIKNMNPAIAGFIESWKNKYDRKYDFSQVDQQALFYEGMLELARFVAKNSEGADVTSLLNPSGFSEIKISLNPLVPSSKPFVS